MPVSRFSVLLVCGTRLNTPRSPSWMRLGSTDWRWAGTAETSVMRWRRHHTVTSMPMAEISALQTETTIFGLTTTAARFLRVGGGLVGAAEATSTEMVLLFGWMISMRKPVACWWNSSSKPADESSHREHYKHGCCNFCTRHCNEWFSIAEHLALQAVLALCFITYNWLISCCRCSLLSLSTSCCTSIKSHLHVSTVTL